MMVSLSDKVNYSKVRLKLHWGFSVAVPRASKAKAAFPLPPPTTLVGALSYGLWRGKDYTPDGKGSPASELHGKVYGAARFGDGTYGVYIEDVVRNVVSYFQKPERRSKREYTFGIVPTGKVYSSGELVVVYLSSQLSTGQLEKLSWSLVRVGSKEGLVSVEDVELGEASRVEGEVTTKFYFPSYLAHEESPFLRQVTFWEGGVVWGEEGKDVNYLIPLRPFPLESVEVQVRAREAYEANGDVVVLG
ncbi:type I-A CRISPR-associated protein Cas5 [Sulfodiicoccus acidiphilus]|uniref:Type I-A CRISPR-associated protein Cas5 n=1 Tax=Sulfodiicoccus acidiphilus TaxID=1670455 RepID=A0A348B5X3_9CREN|nr:type I-A CRISPR-associated protein Cas5a [Sulfodiicoccus acidiphilus]BBD73575.1 type I-A CRISPR-associated protein Cas5 [Sulfodiicoccus acidiphilus]GGU01752.1 type I-A CRISPR-associated protein Cas5 [Sulfodiicoccus acidiphilus]